MGSAKLSFSLFEQSKRNVDSVKKPKFPWPQKPLYHLFLLLWLDSLLLLLLGLLIWQDNALNRGITFTPSLESTPIPWTDGPQVGVNLYNLHLEPEMEVVTKTLKLVKELGAKYVRMQVPWEDLEIAGKNDFWDRRHLTAMHPEGISAWEKYDRIVKTANNFGLELIMRLDRPPAWARPVALNSPNFQKGLLEDGNSTGPPDDFNNYAGFVKLVVARYQGKVRFFQLWNEPNLANEWNWDVPRPEDFVKLLKMGYLAAKEANPAAVILFPSLAPVDGLDKRAPMTELEYLDQVYKAGGGAYFDIMSAQAYGLGQPPSEHRYIRLRPFDNWYWLRPLDTRADVSRLVLLREVMELHGDKKAIWIGEFGWNSAPESIPLARRLTWGKPVNEQEKAQFLIAQIERAKQEWPSVGVLNVWMLRYGGFLEPNLADPTPYFAIVKRDWTLLPAYTQLQTYLSQPTAAGVGIHSWQHPAVEKIANGFKLRFVGQKATMIGDSEAFDSLKSVVLDGKEVIAERGSLKNGEKLLTTPQLQDGLHTLELSASASFTAKRFSIARNPPFPWLCPLAMALIISLLLLSGAATTQILFESLDSLLKRSPSWSILLGMLIGLVIFYRVTPEVPITLLGLAIFGGLAMLRPELALLFVPLTAPFFFMPKGIWDDRFVTRAEGLKFPLQEVVLSLVAFATLLHWLVFHLPSLKIQRSTLKRTFLSLIPYGLLLFAGTLGVLIAAEKGPALREWRWLIFEPLLFYGLLHFYERQAKNDEKPIFAAGIAFVIAGAFVGLVGILQFLGLNLVPLIATKVGFSGDRIFVEGVKRVSSLYGHPNNFGLAMGRVWPLALALAFDSAAKRKVKTQFFYSICAILSLGGLIVSFSKGAWFGALGALLLILHFRFHLFTAFRQQIRKPKFLISVLGLLGIIIVAALSVERLNPMGESSGIRLKTWFSALLMLKDHPLLGIGLDQFLLTYSRYIDPSLLGTNEQFTSHPHNLILDLWLRLGILGLGVFSWLILRFYRLVLPAKASFFQIGLAAAMTAALLHGLVDNFYFVPDLALSLWLFWALAHSKTTKLV